MSKKRKTSRGNPAKTAKPSQSEQTLVWIRTEPTVDGKSFMVVIEIDEDHAITLDRENANAYAYAILEAVARASYDAAVYSQIRTRISEDPHVAGHLIVDLREERPPIDFSIMAPMSFRDGVNQKGKPFLTILFNDEPAGQWDLQDAREHALGVLEAIVVAELDSGYLRALRGLVGLPEGTARNTVDDLQNYRKGYLL